MESLENLAKKYQKVDDHIKSAIDIAHRIKNGQEIEVRPPRYSMWVFFDERDTPIAMDQGIKPVRSPFRRSGRWVKMCEDRRYE